VTAPESTAADPRTAARPGPPDPGSGPAAAGADPAAEHDAAAVAASARKLDFTLLAVAIAGVSMSAPLIAATAAPALAIAFWRNAIAVGVLSPVALWRHRGELRRMGRRALTLSVLAGIVLALHFGMWLPSLDMTSVATSTALVTTTPIWTTLILRIRGHRPPPLVWAGTGLAVVGVLLLTGIDLSGDTRALEGDALALAAGLAAAGYMLLGAEVRRTATTTAYTFVCYGTTAVVLLGACLVSGSALGGYDGGTWLKIAGLTVAAQLLGHSLLNRVVRGLGPSTTSTAILLETPGAALIAALWLGQTPPAAAYPALGVILAGLALVILADRRKQPQP
jgi:drug/metabolite transporter (DMT)-like permease